MYSFTNPDLAQGLIQAKSRGLDVRVVVEKQQAGGQYSQHQELAAAGIPVRIDTNPSLMHHKFAVVDDSTVITGSMNWTGNGVGENNENLVIITSPELNTKFSGEFDAVWNDSIPFEGGTLDAS
jgi:phosphatidylserine/phosphatidylglycerophosphate/cardiolipin synthase-like enzyme